MNFIQFRDLIKAQFKKMQAASPTLFTTDLEKDTVWKTERVGEDTATCYTQHTSIYLDAFEASERQSHTCSCCRQFLRPYAGIVQITADYQIVTIWDVEGAGEYQQVADALRAAVLASKVNGVFVVQKTKDNNYNKAGGIILGTPSNIQTLDDNNLRTWSHFTLDVAKSHVNTSTDSEASVNAAATSSRNTFERSLREITDEAIAIVIEMMTDNDTLRLDEFIPMVKAFKAYKDAYMLLSPVERELYAWLKFSEAGGALSRMRNSAVGRFLTDISEGEDVNRAKASFEAMMMQYKRPTTLATDRQKKEAAAEFERLGLTNALYRRHASTHDISVADVLWKNSTVTMKDTSPFGLLAKTGKVDAQKLGKVVEMPIDKFMSDVLPTITELSVLMEQHHTNHLMNITGAQHADAPSILKWDNEFAWVYNCDVADSIKQHVAAAGGLVNCALRTSLSWHNFDDLDLHVFEPNGFEIYFGNKERTHASSGMLDVDMNAGVAETRKGVENIRYTDKKKMPEGNYRVVVRQFRQRELIDGGFTVELEFEGAIHRFNFKSNGATDENTAVVTFNYTHANGISIVKSGGSTTSAAQGNKVWGLEVDQFHKVQIVCNSPNHWGENSNGNKHTMFLLEGCLNPDKPRGFFNEQLSDSLKAHRKTMEEMGDKLRVEYSDVQLAGLGFNNTTRNSLIVKAKGETERVIKLMF